ncbi:MAG: hypothetical protein A2152_04130 [Candidatus Levybacteria bacterium RBG_16_35_6]|nr:MAG: hypothetical protein A2152_04130 [Candidatus Levybacteria bacterium RBG_16_35_6]
MLPEGEYSLTPSRLKNGSMEHNLVVFKDGTAVYRGLPNDRNVGMIELSAREGKFKSGGRFILIPQDTEVVVISGTTEDGNFGIYDIILYLPDPPQDQMI